jgi:small subunit ribosomal protein S6
MRNYEMALVVRPDLEDEQVEEFQERLEKLITSYQGEIIEQDDWGKRRLAYNVRDYREGFYFFVNFKGTPELAKELDRVLKIADQVLRFMILREGK